MEITYETAKALYFAVLAFFPAEAKAYKAHVDAAITNALAHAAPGKAAHVVAAEVLAFEAKTQLGKIVHKTTPDSHETGAFLTGGHTLYYFDEAAAFLADFPGADKLVSLEAYAL